MFRIAYHTAKCASDSSKPLRWNKLEGEAADFSCEPDLNPIFRHLPANRRYVIGLWCLVLFAVEERLVPILDTAHRWEVGNSIQSKTFPRGGCQG